jgi:hypothetical protein
MQASEILRHGWTENYSGNGPECSHKTNVKQLQKCMNGKEKFLCILRWHARDGQQQYLTQLLYDRFGIQLSDSGPGTCDRKVEKDKIQPCIVGNHYPILESMIAPGLCQREKV